MKSRAQRSGDASRFSTATPYHALKTILGRMAKSVSDGLKALNGAGAKTPMALL